MLDEEQKESLIEQLDSLFHHNPLFYLKFTKESDYADDLVNGVFYSNTPEYFRLLETETGERGQGDKNELMSVIQAFNIQFIGNESDDFNFTFPEAKVTFRFKSDDTTPLICFAGFTVKDLKIISINESQVELAIPYTQEELEEMKEKFGEYCVLFEAGKLMQKLEDYSINNNIAYELKRITYCHPNTKQRLEAFANGSVERFYYKDEDLSYQKEYRLIFDMEIPKNNKIKIGLFENNVRKMHCSELSNYTIVINYK